MDEWMVGNGFYEPQVLTDDSCPLSKLTVNDLNLKETPFFNHDQKVTLGQFLDFHK